MTDKSTIKPITADDPEAKSADVIAANLYKLKELFPEAVTEDGVNVDVLNQLIGKTVSDAEEKYGLTWFGKRKARQLALTPSTGTLRPCPEESVDWDTTQNLFIEGDNLEVLKLLQKSYANKVKLIYIDPPYNTGRDFIYPDDFRDSVRNYKQLTGQIDTEGNAISSNSDTLGRFHTNWLNMLYPRLRLARNLLNDSGVIAISIDDTELPNVRKLCDDVFGEENFVANVIWKKRSTPPNDKTIGTQHDYIVIYCKRMDGVELNLRERTEEQIDRYKNSDNHIKGPWAASDLTANVKGGRFVESLYFPITNPNTGEEHYPSAHGNWRFNRERIERLLANDEIYFGADGKGKPMLKRFLCDIKEGITWTTLWDFAPYNTQGSQEMRALLGSSTMFENPKPSGLLEHVLKLGMSQDGIILDFFAGSCSTAQAAMDMNASDGGTRRFVMVQLPEPCPPQSDPYRAGFITIAAIGKERIRKCGEAIREALANVQRKNAEKLPGTMPDVPKIDVGFRVFKLDASNIRAWNPDPDDLEGTLQDHTEHLVPGRSEVDVLYELLLKLGLDLAVPIETRQIAGKNLHSIGAGTLFACLAESVSRDDVEAVAQEIINWHKELSPEGETTIVFRDSGFVDDVAKSNLAAILVQAGFDETRIRSL